MSAPRQRWISAIGVAGCWVGVMACAHSEAQPKEAEQGPQTSQTLQSTTSPSSSTPPPNETFEQLKARLEAEKPFFMARQLALLAARYDLRDRPSNVKMTRGKPVQAGVRVKLPRGVTFQQLAALTPAEIAPGTSSPRASYRCPIPSNWKAECCFRTS